MKTFRDRRWFLVLLLLLLLLFGSRIAAYARSHRTLATVKSIRQELFSPAGRTLSAEERQKKWSALREAEKNLSAAQRRELSAERRKRRQTEMVSYARMSKAEKTRFLDEQIRRMQQARSQGGGGRGGPSPTQGQTGPDGSTRTGSTTASRDERRQERLDSTTASERAMAAQFFHDLAARRTQLGLSAGGGPGARR